MTRSAKGLTRAAVTLLLPIGAPRSIECEHMHRAGICQCFVLDIYLTESSTWVYPSRIRSRSQPLSGVLHGSPHARNHVQSDAPPQSPASAHRGLPVQR